MTCIVSLRTPHGIVIAGDSQGTGYGEKDFEQKKIFPLFGVYAVGVYGIRYIEYQDRTINIHEFVNEYEKSFKASGAEIPTLTEVSHSKGQAC